jgi:hypothetical protein
MQMASKNFFTSVLLEQVGDDAVCNGVSVFLLILGGCGDPGCRLTDNRSARFARSFTVFCRARMGLRRVPSRALVEPMIQHIETGHCGLPERLGGVNDWVAAACLGC